MSYPRARWVLLLVPLITFAGQSPGPPSRAEPSNNTRAAQPDMERLAQKQREAALAAMQASIDKQRASLATAMAASAGKPAPASPLAVTAGAPFFNLPPLPGPAIAPAFALPEATLADVVCDPVPEAGIAPMILDAAQREGLEPRLLTAMIERESAFRPCAVSQKGAQGLMQLMPETTRKFGVNDPFDARQNIDAGAKYLKELLTRYAGNLALALGAYNAGPGKVDEAGGVPPIPETTAYVSEILGELARQPTSPKPPGQ